MITLNDLEALFNYTRGSVLTWESGVNTTTEATRLFSKRVSRFTVKVIGSLEKPKLLITNIDDENDRLRTSTLQEVKICENGYAVVRTRNSSYHFWNDTSKGIRSILRDIGIVI